MAEKKPADDKAAPSESEVDAATLVARELQVELRARLEKLLSDPRTPQSFIEKFKEQ